MITDSPYAPLLLMLYGAHVTTTVVPILATFWAIPTTVANAVDHSPPFSSISSLHLLCKPRSHRIRYAFH
jgi:hypothetical protein